MTLNYDNGLEIAFAANYSKYVQGITARQENEVNDWLRRTLDDGIAPILHWHGVANDADSIILSGSDYVNFYDKLPSNKDNIRKIFGTSSVLMIGFGFSDPFIVRELNSLMQAVNSSNVHYAIIGIPDNRNISIPLERRRYSTKYKMEPIFYPVSFNQGYPDHSALVDILRYIAEQCPRPNPKSGVVAASNSAVVRAEPASSYRSSLFTIGDSQIYCEPNLWSIAVDDNDKIEKSVGIENIIAEKSHCSITSLHEYGLSNLGRRLASELTVAGKKLIFREADLVPKYRKAFQADREISQFAAEDEFIFIIDNFSAIDHQRTVREISSAFGNARMIILQKERYSETATELMTSLSFRSYSLRGFTRSNIRSVINTIAPTYNSDDTSYIVDKVYADLIQLCIPLTPSNVIMYASVLCKDGSFSPVSRLHIVDRFISEALRRASDAYADTFNTINKIDLLAAFCYDLFEKNVPDFQHSHWVNFCDEYKKRNLVEFDASEIMADLVNGRVVLRDSSIYFFRYRMFFSYFVGRHISASPSLLLECLAENRHLEIDGLVEVLCGTLPDASIVLDDLTGKLEESFDKFYRDYPIQDLDFHAGQRWEIKKEEKIFWDRVSDRLANGPASTQELDVLKTSIHAERRTADQKVSIIKFIASEKSVAVHHHHLMTALENTKHASAASKKAATMAVIKGTVLVYEVATVFVPLIAEKKYVSWNGFTYINLIEDNVGAESALDVTEERERMCNLVAYSLPTSIGHNAADQYGSRKLGQVFLSLMEKREDYSPIKQFILFALLLRSKPTGWLHQAKKYVTTTDRYDLYLKHMLTIGMRQFRSEINTEAERRDLRELMASMRLRRDANLKKPSSSQIKDAIGKLEEHGYWDEAVEAKKEDKDDKKLNR
ncbi:hypothetical protein B2G69_25330 [Methylorubrum zatmanii]|nr:hypothetical protein B2G69_25330 [Methylorubrum zatmanii]